MARFTWIIDLKKVQPSLHLQQFILICMSMRSVMQHLVTILSMQRRQMHNLKTPNFS